MDLLYEKQRWSVQQVQGIQSLYQEPYWKEVQDQIIVDNSLRMNSKSYTKKQGLRGSCQLLIIHNRMGLQNGRMEFQVIWREEQNSEYDQKNPVKECEDLECRDHAVIRVSQIKNNLKR